MPDLVLDYHRRKVPIDHPDLSITRAKLEYPAENVSFSYLGSIGKICCTSWFYGTDTWRYFSATILHKEVFTDKSVFLAGVPLIGLSAVARLIDKWNHYICRCYYSYGYIYAYIEGSYTYLGEVNFPFPAGGIAIRFGASGSAIILGAWAPSSPMDPLDPPSPEASVQVIDTTFTSGYFGVLPLMQESYAKSGSGGSSSISFVLPSSTPGNKALAVLEVSPELVEPRLVGPSLSKELIEITYDMDIPEYLKLEKKRYDLLKSKGFTDEEIKLIFGVEPLHQIDVNGVSWGAFEFRNNSPTNIIAVYSDNQLKSGAVERQVEFTRSKGLRVFKPPKDYGEAVSQYNELRREFKHWLAGKDDYAFFTLGDEVFNTFQNVDFYYGELIEHKTHYSQLRRVSEYELRRRFNDLMRKLSKVTVLTEERDKHLSKLSKIVKLGW